MSYVGFSKLKSKIAKRGGVRDPGAVAAAIGRKKYGKKRFQAAAAKGKKLRGAKHRGGKRR
jgi:hypothetical protein